MSHPKDRRERFLIGANKGKKRAQGLLCSSKPTEKTLRYFSYILRNTTKLCSCDMCGNPRRTAWESGGSLTMQEKKQKDWKSEIQIENNGAITQLEECQLCKLKVRGSNPRSSTYLKENHE